MSDFKVVPIVQLRESASNPRRRFNEQKMQDLIQSVRERGILNPLLVRLVDNEAPAENSIYEILAGSRRYRAALVAELLELPAIIKYVTDDEALEIQLFENDQREDVHPLEQAIGYKQWMDRPGHTIDALAAKLGCSESHIYRRLKLLDLIAPAQEAFLDEKITAEHAVLIARLQPKDQEKAFKNCFEQWKDNQLVSAKRLREWIENELHLDLDKACFKLTDEDLGPGSCVNCSKRTGFLPQLFADIAKNDTCTDSACFKKKTKAYIDRQLAAAREKNEELLEVTLDFTSKEGGPLARDKFVVIHKSKDSCESAKKALVVAGRDSKGKALKVCADPKCKVHKKSISSGMGRASGGSNQDYKKQQQAQKDKAEKEQRIREKILDAIMLEAGNADWDREDWNLIGYVLLDRLNYEELRLLGKRYGYGDEEDKGKIAKKLLSKMFSMDISELCPFLIELCLSELILVSWWGEQRRPELLNRVAQRFGVSIKALEKEQYPPVSETKPPKNPDETKAPKAETKEPASKTKPVKKVTKAQKRKTARKA